MRTNNFSFVDFAIYDSTLKHGGNGNIVKLKFNFIEYGWYLNS